MAKRLVPLLDRILVERLTPQTKSIGGVLLPDSAGKVLLARPTDTIAVLDVSTCATAVSSSKL